MRLPAGHWGCPGPGSTSTKTAGSPRGQRGGRPWPRRSAGCSRPTGAPTGRRGSPLTCARPGGRSARTPSPPSCASRAWPRGGRRSAGPLPGRAKGAGARRTWSGGTSPRQKINTKWYGDGTEIKTSEGKLYLASVMDMASRRVLGFAVGEHHDAQLAYSALVMAVAVRGGQVPGVIMHTDRGSEYTAGLVRQACTRLGISQSMGRPGSALDNAVIESWHSTLEFELRAVEHFTTRAAARTRVSAWIEDYNTRRRHSALGMMSPVRYEQALQEQAA